MTLPPEITLALIGLIAAFITALGAALAWIGQKLPGWIERGVEAKLKKLETDLAANTSLTQQARDATNGQLAAARQEATKYRLLAERYGRIIRKLNENPDARLHLDAAAQALRQAEYDPDWAAMQRKLLGEELHV